MPTEATRPEWIRVRAAGDTHIGLRDHNEDAVLLRKELGLFVLADGAGGESAGSTASALATTAIAHYFERTQAEAREAPTFDALGLATEARRLSASVHAANDEIHHLSGEGGRYAGMLKEIQPLTRLLTNIGQEHGSKSAAQVALNWLICKGALPIPGAKNVHQAEINAGAAGWRLTPAQVQALDEASDKLSPER